MKIGEFSRACNVPISVLHYYDRYGLLKPDYIDRFTGYRYYSENQIRICARINALKAAGFSLSEIKQMLSRSTTSEDIARIFDNRKKKLNEILHYLDELRDIILGGNSMAKTKIQVIHEDVQIPFENDEKIIGKWKIIGEYNNRTEFDLGQTRQEEAERRCWCSDNVTVIPTQQRTSPARTIFPFPFVTTRILKENGNPWLSSWIKMILIPKTSPAARICILKKLNFCQTVNASVFMETKP